MIRVCWPQDTETETLYDGEPLETVTYETTCQRHGLVPDTLTLK